ncbi:hypothetical protein K491DRAFT_753913 [Lophiostoma macrostomum CBS 122681]|uniref:AA1-like domain-containing protein n=1 Tax=Lophiostoma macrostomum CBS 122681 TaxID=1314788 RepID=A0A6A6TMG9_9PLEO|nr:hypothetical protein K491DRAFT_753913 [Lophiostoma macrostomum CBS 122681]
MPTPKLLLATLTSLATLATTTALPQPHHLTTRDTSLTLSDITYTSSEVYSTPAHLATYGGYISFNLSNPSISYITPCSARGVHLQDFFYGEITYTCDKPADTTAGVDAAATFTFSRPDNTFTVNQTWDSDGAIEAARGSGKVDLNCETTVWQNPNWTMGQLYSTTDVTCDTATLVIDASSD